MCNYECQGISSSKNEKWIEARAENYKMLQPTSKKTQIIMSLLPEAVGDTNWKLFVPPKCVIANWTMHDYDLLLKSRSTRHQCHQLGYQIKYTVKKQEKHATSTRTRSDSQSKHVNLLSKEVHWVLRNALSPYAGSQIKQCTQNSTAFSIVFYESIERWTIIVYF